MTRLFAGLNPLAVMAKAEVDRATCARRTRTVNSRAIKAVAPPRDRRPARGSDPASPHRSHGWGMVDAFCLRLGPRLPAEHRPGQRGPTLRPPAHDVLILFVDLGFLRQCSSGLRRLPPRPATGPSWSRPGPRIQSGLMQSWRGSCRRSPDQPRRGARRLPGRCHNFLHGFEIIRFAFHSLQLITAIIFFFRHTAFKHTIEAAVSTP